MSSISLRRPFAGLVLGAAALAVVPAYAGPIVSVSLSGAGSSFTSSGEATDPDGDGVFTRSGSFASSGALAADWATGINPDPVLHVHFTLTNLSASTQAFIITVTLPIAPIGPGTLQGGFFGQVTYTDTSRDGSVTFGNDGVLPEYSAIVGGLVSQDLGFSVPKTVSGPAGVSDSFGPLGWGEPVPSAHFGPATSPMQIRNAFTLTSGDTVEIDDVFQIKPGEAVPEPGTLALLAAGLAVVAGVRLRG